MASPIDAASPYVTVLVSLVLGLFGGGSLVALVRVRVDKDQVVVAAAQGAVIVQASVIGDLQKELDRLKAQVSELCQKAERDEAEMDRLRAENRDLRRRLELLERP